MYRRRARPTLRVLTEDLTSDWKGGGPRRWIDQGAHRDLLPLSELAHPLIAKAVGVFGDEPQQDSPEGRITSSTLYPSWEIKAAQWRGAVWCDESTGVHWLVAGGLAKGDHQDHEDFYRVVERAHRSGAARAWLPIAEDIRLLKIETAAAIDLRWQLDLQNMVYDELRGITFGGVCEFDVPHPLPAKVKPTERTVAHVTLTVEPVRDDGVPRDEIVVDVAPTGRWMTDPLTRQANVRLLISIHAPEQDWDVGAGMFSTWVEPGSLRTRCDELTSLVARGELAEAVPGRSAHVTHREHLAEKTMNGEAVRALCGVFFVPRQDHVNLPGCARCAEILGQLSSRR